jgi:hypothetical protein
MIRDAAANNHHAELVFSLLKHLQIYRVVSADRIIITRDQHSGGVMFVGTGDIMLIVPSAHGVRASHKVWMTGLDDAHTALEIMIHKLGDGLIGIR